MLSEALLASIGQAIRALRKNDRSGPPVTCLSILYWIRKKKYGGEPFGSLTSIKRGMKSLGYKWCVFTSSLRLTNEQIQAREHYAAEYKDKSLRWFHNTVSGDVKFFKLRHKFKIIQHCLRCSPDSFYPTNLFRPPPLFYRVVCFMVMCSCLFTLI